MDIYELGLIYKVDVSDELDRADRHDPDRAGLKTVCRAEMPDMGAGAAMI